LRARQGEIERDKSERLKHTDKQIETQRDYETETAREREREKERDRDRERERERDY